MLHHPSIFISYRREESIDFSRKIYDCLAEKFGPDSVFRDLDSIVVGSLWRESLEVRLAQCQIFIAVIGKKWISLTRNGQRRLDDPKDWVRLEIEYALEQGIKVIPVLVDGTKMPSEDELPGFWLKKLPALQAMVIKDDPFLKPSQVDQLIQNIYKQLNEPQTKNFQENLNQQAALGMVYVEKGSFWMGSHSEDSESYEKELPYHKVKVSPFWMSRYPVTQLQWNTVSLFDSIDLEIRPDPSPHFKGDNLPVINISWHEAVEFCKRLHKYTNRLYRLPSEAEWEYACRAGTSTPFYFGSSISESEANYSHGETYTVNEKVIPVSAKPTYVRNFHPNAFGFYDMHGNVFEWCQDHWHENYEGAPKDSRAWVKDGNEKYRVIRGGAWNSASRFCRSSYRNAFSTTDRYIILGFRVACSSE